MLIDIVMPQMGESLAEGTVVRWLKKAGDRVERDEPLFEISTDKVDTDVPSPAEGTLASIVVAEGQTVGVGARVAVIDDGAAAIAEPPAGSKAAAQSAAAEESGGHFKNAHAPQLVSFRRAHGNGGAGSPVTAAVDAGPEPGLSGHAGVESRSLRNRSFSPAVLDTARRAGVSLQSLTTLAGSGRGGRITKADVARFIESGGALRAAAPAVAAPHQIPREYVYSPAPDDEVVPMSHVRKRIADHMTWSVRISPHASAFAECDMNRVVAQVRQERETFAARVGAPLTFTVVAACALARTVREFPVFNASVVEDAIVMKPRVNLGIAVALPDTDDLIVPVVREADGLSLEGMARAINDLTTRARSRRLRPEDVQGGTITLTNPGMFGGVTGTPILNQPQVAIVGLGAIVKRAVVVDDNEIVPRPMMTVALTFDHRAADGMAAFKFLDRLKTRLEAGVDAR